MAGDVKVAVVSGQISTGSTGNVNLTKSGFGTPKACIIIFTRDYIDDTVTVPQSQMSVGFSEFTNDYCITHQDEDASAKVDCDSLKSNTLSYALLDATAALQGSGTASTVTDGVKLTNTTAPGGLAPFATVNMFGGADLTVALTREAINSSQNGTATRAHSGFTNGNDKLIFFVGVDRAGEDSARTGIANSFGVCHVSGSDLEWTKTGNSKTITSAGKPSLAAMSSTRVAFFDATNIKLETYDFDGSDWTLTGNSKTITGATSGALAALSSTRVAFHDRGTDKLEAYDFDESDWTLTGNSFTLTTTTNSALAAMSSTRVAYHDIFNDKLEAYDFDGTDWTKTGNSFTLVTSGSIALTALSATRVAYHDIVNDKLEAYDFDGTNWTKTGNSFTLAREGGVALATLSSSRVAFFGSSDANLEAYDFDGTDWTKFGDSLTITGAGSPALAGLTGTRVAFFDATNDKLETYDLATVGYTFTQRCMGWASDHANTIAQAWEKTRTTRVLEIIKEDGTQDWSLEVTAFSSSGNTFTVTTRDAGAGTSMEVYSLALDLDDRKAKVGSVDSPTSGTTWSITGMGFTPQYVGLGLNGATIEDILTGAGRVGISSNTGSSEETCHTWYNEDAAPTTNTNTLFRSRVIDFRSDDTGTVIQDHSHSSFDSGGVTHTINTVNESPAKKWLFWAIQAIAGVGLSPAEIITMLNRDKISPIRQM